MISRAAAARDPNGSMPGHRASLGAASAQPPFKELTHDHPLAGRIAHQLMQLDQTDEPIAGHPPQATTARPARSAEDVSNTGDAYAIVRLLHETTRLWRSRYDGEMRTQLPGMTFSQCTVLTQLAQHEGLNQAALAQTLNIRPISLVRLIDRLEAADFVARIPDPDDRRAYFLVLTAKALPIIEHIYAVTREINDNLQFGISKAQATQLRALLCRIRTNLTGRAGDIPSSPALRRRGGA